MSEDTEGTDLLNRADGTLAWQCYQGGTFEQVRDAYKRKHGQEPQFVIPRDGMWWAGPIDKQVAE